MKVLLLSILITFSFAAEIYVSSTGSDATGCGSTKDNACASMFYAIGASQPNDRILLYPGTYRSSGMSAVISHNLTIGAAVEGEGPPVIDFEVLFYSIDLL